MAAVYGVESAVKLHIRRGDDLDARDAAGATPLMLAASKKRARVVRLLLEAGADSTLLDSNGCNALGHAVRSGCEATIALLQRVMNLGVAQQHESVKPAEAHDTDGPAPVTSVFVPRASDEECRTTLDEPSGIDRVVRVDGVTQFVGAERVDTEPVSSISYSEYTLSRSAHRTDDSAFFAVHPPVDESGRKPLNDKNTPQADFVLDAEVLASDLDDWESEEELEAPEGDDTVALATSTTQRAITDWKPVDSAEDWGDVDLFLPDRARPVRQDNASAVIERLLLGALREGFVHEVRIVEACLDEDGCRNEDAERWLRSIIDELEACVVDWVDPETRPMDEPSLEEYYHIREAMDLFEDLMSGRGDLYRIYIWEMRGRR